MACLIELGDQRGRNRLGQGEGHFNLRTVLHLAQRAACGLQLAAGHAFQRVGQGAAQGDQPHDGCFFSAQQRLGNTVGVGAHQAAGTQVHAAVVAHHRGQHAVQILLAQHFQHGPPSCAAGLAIVHRRRVSTGQQRLAHMRRRRVLRAQHGHHLLRRRPIRHGLYAADETALFDQQFAGAGGGEGLGHVESDDFALDGVTGLRLQSLAELLFLVGNDHVAVISGISPSGVVGS